MALADTPPSESNLQIRMTAGARIQQILAYAVVLSLPLEAYTFADFGSVSLSASRVALLVFYIYLSIRLLFGFLGHGGNVPTYLRNFLARRSIVIVLCLLAYHLTLLLSTQLSNIVPLTPNIVLRIFAGLLVFLVPLLTIHDVKELGSFLVLIIVITFYSELTTVLASLNIMPEIGFRISAMQGTGAEYFSFRSTGLINAFGDHASLFSFALPVLILSIVRGSKLWHPGSVDRFIAIALLIFLGFSSLALQSRNVWITSLVSVVLFVGFNTTTWIRRTRKGCYLLLSLILIPLSICMVSSGFIIEFAREISDSFVAIRPQSVDSRLVGYDLGYQIFQQSPWLGIGPYAFTTLFGLYIHNMILNLLVSGGVIAVIFIGCSLGILLVGLIRRLGSAETTDSTPELMLAGFLGLITSGMFYVQISSWIFWFLLGIVAAYLNISRTGSSTNQD